MPSNGTYVGGGLFVAVVGFICWLHRQLKRHDADWLRDKVVVITGASSGLGEACAEAMFRAGAKVVLCSRREGELERVKSMLMAIKLRPGLTQHEPRIVSLDLEDFANIPSKVSEMASIHGTIDILVNNAGISSRGDIESTSFDVFRKLINVNYLGQVAITQAVLPHMIRQKSGHIINIGSVQGKIAIPYRSAYAASKHATQAFYDSLRAEVAHYNIHVSVVNPGYISTNLSVNAVTASGSTYGVTDSTTAEGMPPAQVASEVIKAICSRTNEVTVANLSHKMAIYLRNIVPNLYFMLMKSRAKKQRNDYLKNR